MESQSLFEFEYAEVQQFYWYCKSLIAMDAINNKHCVFKFSSIGNSAKYLSYQI